MYQTLHLHEPWIIGLYDISLGIIKYRFTQILSVIYDICYFFSSVCITNNMACKQSVIIKNISRVNVTSKISITFIHRFNQYFFSSSFKNVRYIVASYIWIFCEYFSLETAASKEFNLMMIVVKIFSLLLRDIALFNAKH